MIFSWHSRILFTSTQKYLLLWSFVEFALLTDVFISSFNAFFHPSTGWVFRCRLLVSTNHRHHTGAYMGRCAAERVSGYSHVSTSVLLLNIISLVWVLSVCLCFLQILCHQRWSSVCVLQQFPAGRWGGVWRNMGAHQRRLYDILRFVPGKNLFVNWCLYGDQKYISLGWDCLCAAFCHGTATVKCKPHDFGRKRSVISNINLVAVICYAVKICSTEICYNRYTV